MVFRARTRLGSKAPTLGLFVDWLEDGYQSAVAGGVLAGAEAAGATMVCFAGGAPGSPGRSAEQRNHVFDLASAETIDALVLMSGSIANHIGQAGVSALAERYRALPRCSIALELPTVPSVLVDNAAGMRAGSHNEAFDLVKLPDGTFIYDHIIAMTDPKLIGFQFQMSTYNSGMIAAEYFAKYPTRFFSMHVQDLDIKAGRTPVVNGRGGGYPQTSVGKGGLDWAATFAAARKAGGIKNYFVEQAMPMTIESVAALKAMKA